jgi:hypothetical protein
MGNEGLIDCFVWSESNIFSILNLKRIEKFSWEISKYWGGQQLYDKFLELNPFANQFLIYFESNSLSTFTSFSPWAHLLIPIQSTVKSCWDTGLQALLQCIAGHMQFNFSSAIVSINPFVLIVLNKSLFEFNFNSFNPFINRTIINIQFTKIMIIFLSYNSYNIIITVNTIYRVK